MPAVTIDVNAVDGSNTHIWPNPIAPFYGPFVVNSQNVDTIAGPVSIGSITIGEIGAPINITADTPLTVGIPNAVASGAVVTIDIPTDITEISALSIAVPISVTSQAVGSVAIPVDIAELSIIGIAIPVDVTESAVVDIAIPATITANAVPSSTPTFPLNHARILYDNLLIGSTVTSNSGTNPSYTLTPNTANRWELGTGGAITFELPVAADIDTVCIGAHNLSGTDYTVGITYDDDLTGGFTAFTTGQTPADDTAIMFHIGTAVSVRRLVVTCSGTGTGKYIGSIYAGVALQMQRPFFSGHSPLRLSASTSYYSARSESGNFIGREIRRQEFQSSMSWKNLENDWYRTYFQPFVISAKTLPFYVAWNLLDYPLDVCYAFTSDDIQPSYQGQLDLMQVSVDLLGVG